MRTKTNAGIFLEPERYELRAAAPYRFDLDRRDFFKFLGAGVVVVSVLKPAIVAQESGGGRQRRGESLPQQIDAWLHLGVTAGVVAAGFFFGLTVHEWCWIILAMAIVWTAEALNTAFEFLADAASPTFHPLVRDAKDVAAGAVLVTAVGAAIVGLIIFWPHVATLFS